MLQAVSNLFGVKERLPNLLHTYCIGKTVTSTPRDMII